MGELHKKYRKFITTAASAALVASAVAPVASAKSFSDTKGNTHEAAIDALSDAGVISGYPDGTFQPNKTLTRSDVVKLMGKWLVSEGYAIPSDAVSNPRFADLKSTSNKELLEYAAVVKDNGVFVGTPDGKLDPAGNITRENMAIVLVRAFDRVNDIDLTAFVAGQDFKKDVTDLGSAKAEARPAIDVLDFFDITNPAAPAFNPKATTTRGHFATFLHKFSTTDFSDVIPGAVVGSTAVKAVNATTVEVTFKDAVENVNSLNFTIEGLTVSNAAVKQSDNKTVVLTTAVQEGGKEYTVSLDGKAIGKFKGVSAVVPTKINITTQSVQGKVGQQAIVSADVGVKQAGIAVTFNVKADTTGTLNKDQVFEAVTDENGIATFSYTQYAAGTDEVVAYPTGAPSVRSLGYVFWGVDTILSVEEVTKGDTVNNGANKTYKVKYLDPKTGKAVAGKRFVVSFEENINVNVNQLSNAKVNNVQPSQLLNGTAPEGAVITTDGKGEATFTVTGENTSVTPVVFEQPVARNSANNPVYTKEFTRDLLQTKASKVTFGAAQSDYIIEMFGSYGEDSEAAVGIDNGREFTLMVTDKEGMPVANETVNIAFNEDLDGDIKTNTNAYFVEWAQGGPVEKQISYQTNSYGEIIFQITSDKEGDYATPIAWIDINSADANEGKLDKEEPSQVGPITYFAKEKIAHANFYIYDQNGKTLPTGQTAFNGDDIVTLEYTAFNQSFFPLLDLPEEYSHLEATYTVWNTGGAEVIVKYVSKDGTSKSQIISPNRSYTTADIWSSRYENPQIIVQTVGSKPSSVKVAAVGTAQPDKSLPNNTAAPINFGSIEDTVKFTTPTTEVPALYTGTVTSYNSVDKTLTFDSKKPISYTGIGYTYFGGNGAQLANANDFIKELTSGGEAVVTRTVNEDGTVKFSIVSISTGGTPPQLETAPPVANKVPVTKNIATQVIASNGTALNFTASDLATDADGDTLNIVSAYSLDPAVATVRTNGTPAVSIDVDPVAEGSTTVTAVVTDNKGGFVTVNFTVTVGAAVNFNILGNPAVEYSEVAATQATIELTPGANLAGNIGFKVTKGTDVTTLTADLPANATAAQIAKAINDQAAIDGVTGKIIAETTEDGKVSVSSVETGMVTLANSTPLANVTASTPVNGTAVVKNPAKYSFKVAGVPAAGKVVTVKVGNETYTYTVVAADDTAAKLASKLVNAINTANGKYSASLSGTETVVLTQTAGNEASTNGVTLSVTNN